MTILVTGAAGYIGSHTVLCLLQAGFSVIALDNLSNGSRVSLERVANLASGYLEFVEGDVRDDKLLSKLFIKHQFKTVIHFAGLKTVSESSQQPLRYYQNNVAGTVNLLESMASAGVKRFVFSSSAIVYGNNTNIPYAESLGQGSTGTPYAETKVMVERILQDLAASDPEWEIIALRYFNPIGAHASGLIGEDPNGIPNNLMPCISQVAVGRISELSIFGDDYDTPDGTCRRDFIHVMDLAEGHLSCITNLKPGFNVINLGTGKPVSVLEMVHSFMSETGVNVPHSIVERREGDIPESWADVTKAKTELNWEARRTLKEMLRDSWNWQRNNPDGY